MGELADGAVEDLAFQTAADATVAQFQSRVGPGGTEHRLKIDFAEVINNDVNFKTLVVTEQMIEQPGFAGSPNGSDERWG